MMVVVARCCFSVEEGGSGIAVLCCNGWLRSSLKDAWEEGSSSLVVVAVVPDSRTVIVVEVDVLLSRSATEEEKVKLICVVRNLVLPSAF